jgi:hypothetical protein
MDQTIKEQIKKELGMENLTEERMNIVVADLGGLIMQNVLINFTGMLTDDEILEWDEVLNSKDQEKISSYIEAHVPDVDLLVAQSSREVIEEYKKG